METEGSSTADTNRAYSDKRSREDKCGNNMPKSVGRVCALVGPTYHRGG